MGEATSCTILSLFNNLEPMLHSRTLVRLHLARLAPADLHLATCQSNLAGFESSH